MAHSTDLGKIENGEEEGACVVKEISVVPNRNGKTEKRSGGKRIARSRENTQEEDNNEKKLPNRKTCGHKKMKKKPLSFSFSRKKVYASTPCSFLISYRNPLRSFPISS